MSDGTIRTFTTEDIAREAGSDEPNTIERMTVDKKMRWMPKYVSPLVEIPINRALDGRCKSGVPQQVLVTAMCCSHAKLVCEQVATMFSRAFAHRSVTAAVIQTISGLTC